MRGICLRSEGEGDTVSRLENNMKWATLICGCVLLVAATSSRKTASETIALDQIWAYEIPGTHDVRELEPQHFGKHVADLSGEQQLKLLHGSRTQQILDSLVYLREEEKLQAQPGFAVTGSPAEALRQAHDVLANKRKPRHTFSDKEDIYAIFFSHQFGNYVRINKVVRKNTDIEIEYQFVPHRTKEVTNHFAIIPLGKLPVGKYHVAIVQAPQNGNRKLGSEVENRIVCHPFSFSIKKIRE
jgi:hypothetical protein